MRPSGLTRMTRIVILGNEVAPESFFMKAGYIYIMANNRPTLYTGVTNNLVKRVYEHKNNLNDGFTSRYRLHKLVYYEVLPSIELAIIREKQIKDIDRADKIKLIEKLNPSFEDLYSKVIKLV